MFNKRRLQTPCEWKIGTILLHFKDRQTTSHSSTEIIHIRVRVGSKSNYANSIMFSAFRHPPFRWCCVPAVCIEIRKAFLYMNIQFIQLFCAVS